MRTPSPALLAVVGLLLGCGPRPRAPEAQPPSEAAAPHLARVVRVIDGDTLVAVTEEGEVKVRLREVNTPERGECGAEQATALLTELAGDAVRLEPAGEGPHGRLLAHAFTADGAHIGIALAESGLAHVSDYGDPDGYLPALEQAESAAREAGRGLYGSELGCGKAAVAASGAESPLKLVALDTNPPGDDLGPAGESVTLEGPPGFALTGWSIKDTSASHRYSFPDGATVPSTGRVQVFSGPGEDREGAFYWGMKGSAVWNNGGDTAFLIAPGGGIVGWLEAPGG